MKKSTGVVGVVVVVAAAWLGSTWYVGQKAQSTIEGIVARTNERLVGMLGPDVAGGQAALVIDEYDRHFFSSDVSYTLAMKDDQGNPIELKLKDHLQHGPFPLAALRDGHLGPVLAHSRAQLVPSASTQAWFDSQKGEAPMVVETRVGLNGSGQSLWSFAPAEFEEGGDRLSFSGGTLKMEFSNDFQDSNATGQFHSFSLANEETGKNLVVKDVRIESRTQTDDAGIMRVQSKATAEAVNVDEQGAQPILVQDVSVHLDSAHSGNLLDGSLRYDFGHVKVGVGDLGSVSLGGKVARVDVQALTALIDAYDAIKLRQGVQNDEDVELTPEDEAALQDRLMTVLAADPSVSVDPILWKNEKGESRLSMQVDLTRPDASAAGSADILLPQVLKQVRLQLSLAKPMIVQAFAQTQGDANAEQAQQMAEMGAMMFDQYVSRLQQAGLVTVEADTASTTLRYENDAIDVNGQSMPVDEFIQRLISVAM